MPSFKIAAKPVNSCKWQVCVYSISARNFQYFGHGLSKVEAIAKASTMETEGLVCTAVPMGQKMPEPTLPMF